MTDVETAEQTVRDIAGGRRMKAKTQAKGERHIIARGGGKFDVIAGTKVNDRPLYKDEAEDLVTLLLTTKVEQKH